MKTYIFILAISFLLLLTPGCSKDEEILHDGYYSAITSKFNKHGWKSIITLYIYNKRIITVEYNVQNPTGLTLGWDVLQLGELNKIIRMHPNHVIRLYSQELLDRQSPRAIRKVSGDAYFFEAFVTLAEAAIRQAKMGDKTVAVIDLQSQTMQDN